MATQPGENGVADFIHDGFRYYGGSSGYSNRAVGVAPLGEVKWALDEESNNDIFGIVASEHYAVIAREEGEPLRVWPDGSFEELVLPSGTYYGSTCITPDGDTIMLVGSFGQFKVVRFSPEPGAEAEVLFSGQYLEDLLVTAWDWPAFEGIACDGRWLVVSSYGSFEGKTSIKLYGFDLDDMPAPGEGAKWATALPTGINFNTDTWGMRSTTERLLLFSKTLLSYQDEYDSEETISGGIYLAGPWSAIPTEVWRAEFASREDRSWSLYDAYLTDEMVVVANAVYYPPDSGGVIGRIHSLVDGSLVAELKVPEDSWATTGWSVAMKDGVIGIAYDESVPT